MLKNFGQVFVLKIISWALAFLDIFLKICPSLHLLKLGQIALTFRNSLQLNDISF